MSDELRELRAAVYNLSNADWIKRTDEEWYDELWKLLEPVVDVRAERSYAALTRLSDEEYLETLHGRVVKPAMNDAQHTTTWASWTSENPPAHVDSSELDDPDNG